MTDNLDPKTPFQKIVPKPWGHEVIFAPENLSYTGKIEVINAGKRTSLHYHEAKLETMVLVSGKAVLWLADDQGQIEKIEMEPQKGYTIPLKQVHRFEAIEDSMIIEASEPEKGTTVRVEDDYTRSNEDDETRKDPMRGWSGQA
jgi:mannose-6-phosphate isomerase-like protein (cupin superfamily)